MLDMDHFLAITRLNDAIVRLTGDLSPRFSMKHLQALTMIMAADARREPITLADIRRNLGYSFGSNMDFLYVGPYSLGYVTWDDKKNLLLTDKGKRFSMEISNILNGRRQP